MKLNNTKPILLMGQVGQLKHLCFMCRFLEAFSREAIHAVRTEN